MGFTMIYWTPMNVVVGLLSWRQPYFQHCTFMHEGWELTCLLCHPVNITLVSSVQWSQVRKQTVKMQTCLSYPTNHVKSSINGPHR